MKRVVTCLSILCFLLSAATISQAATYYIRTDGGTAQQCSGLADAAYPGSGENQACAWAHPFWALDSGGSWRINGGDTLLIDAGSYMMGYGAPNTGWCDAEGSYGCYFPPVPSGTDSLNPTRILGKGWNSGCSIPPELWGTQRTYHILNLEGTSDAIIDCFEITDHAGCVEYHSNLSVRCERDTYPYGEWADRGIYASDSSNVTLRHLNIHGLSGGGIHAGRISNWTVEDVRIAGNGLIGWDGDLWEGDDSNSGTITFRRVAVEWNGCVETYPGMQPDHCWAQSAGGYGDGIGVGRSGGHWIIEDSVIRHNTSDGVDLLYVGVDNPGSMVEIRRTTAEGNAGNQIKAGGSSSIVNSLVVGNCGYFFQKSFAQEMGDNESGDQCRAGGASLSLNLGRGDTASVVNSTIAGHGWALIEAQCITLDFPDQPSCNGTEAAVLQNNIWTGYPYFLRDDGTLSHFVGDGDPNGFTAGHVDYNIIHNAQILSSTGSHDIFSNPLLVNTSFDNFDAHLQAGSPAVDSGLPSCSLGGLVPSDDITGAARPAGPGVDRGAYEYGAVVSNLPNISVSPGSFNFGNINTGIASLPRTFTLSNTGAQDLVISSMAISGADAGMFSLQTGTCPSLSPTLVSGGSCTVTVVFTPSAEGGRNTILQILSNDPDTPTLNVVLSGTGTVDNPDLPDLTGEWQSISQTCKNTKQGMKCKIKGVLRVTNTGTENASSAAVRFYLSANSTQDATDAELKQVSTGTMKTGKTKSKKFSYKFSTGSSASCQSVIAVIDADNAIEEISETNNQVVHFFDTGECIDTTSPSVILTSPAGNATGVSVNTLITAMFSEALDPSTINTSTFTVNGVIGTVNYSGTTATFTPSGSLNENTTYTATITTGVRDNAGNAMASDYVWSFTTGSSSAPPPATLTNLFFLHHSTGEGLVVEGDMRSVIASYNSSHGTQFEFWDHGYNSDGLRNAQGDVTGTNYNIPGDNTDPDGLYNLWTSTETEYVNARNQILNNHQVIAFKSCFPASDIPDAATLAQYQSWYLGMRDFFDTRTDRLFIVMSNPPLHRLATDATTAANARAFADWLCSDTYLSGHPNVRCFNLFDYLARQNDGSATANMLRYEYEGSHSDSDSHPNTLANQTVGPVFAEFMCNAATGY